MFEQSYATFNEIADLMKIMKYLSITTGTVTKKEMVIVYLILYVFLPNSWTHPALVSANNYPLYPACL